MPTCLAIADTLPASGSPTTSTLPGGKSLASSVDASSCSSLFILGTTNGTATDFDGYFTITTSKDFPIQIEISSLGYTSQIIDVTSADQELSIQLELGSDFLDEVIISASRRAEKIVDAPASVSVISARKIANSAEAIDPMRHLMNVL